MHLDPSQWTSFVSAAQHRGLTVNVHWPLHPRYRLDALQADPERRDSTFGTLAQMVDFVANGQDWPPALVVHGISGDAEMTHTSLEQFASHLQHAARICIELRVPLSADDTRWDRSILSLADQIAPPVGICWDIANQWLGAGSTDLPTEARSAIQHIHLHDSRPDLTLHAPLDSGEIDWRTALASFLDESPWQGCLTLEIRYRYASEVGEPWIVLDDSLRRAASVLNHGAT